MKNGDRIEERHGASERPSQVERPRPDDPIFAAFGIGPAAAEAAQAAATATSRRILRSALAAGLAVFGLAGGFFLWRESAMMAHAESLKAAAATTTTTGPAAAHASGDAFDTAMSKAMMDMHMAMDLPYSGNPDRDFARMMIPHHQGAIDMAQLELAYGEDARLRRLAEEIIVTQQQEIAVMRLVLQDIAAGRAAPDDGQHAMQMTGTHAMDGMKMDMPPAMHGTADQGATAP